MGTESRPAKKRVYGSLVLAVALACIGGLVVAALRSKRGLWTQVSAGIEAFGGLIGVALIGIAAFAVLFIVDSWMARRDERKEHDSRS